MRIVVLAKPVPDTGGERRLDLETGLADRQEDGLVIDEVGERALEAALSFADTRDDVEVVAVAVAPEQATTGIRKCLAMGAHRAVHVADPGLVGADLGLTAEVLAAAVARLEADLVIAGNQSTDGMGGMLPAMLAELLGQPNVTNLSEIEIGADEVRGVRVSDGALVDVSAPLPAVVSVTEQFPEARFPNFKGIMAAKKKPIETLDLAELGIDAEDMAASRGILLGVSERPPRAAGVKIVDEGDAAGRLAAFLADNRLLQGGR